VKHCLLTLFLLAAVLCPAPAAMNASHPTAPLLAPDVAAPERDALAHSADLLAQGQFAPAAACIQPALLPARARVYVDAAPVPPNQRAAYRQAAQQAIDAWNRALGGMLRFHLTDRLQEADVLLLFERFIAPPDPAQTVPACVDATLEGLVATQGAPPTRRAARVWIALHVPFSEELHSPASITHLVGQGLGAYLGLAPTEDPTDLMGPDTHDAKVSVKPSARDLQVARQLQQVRLALLEFARKRVVIHVPKPALVAEKLSVDAGEVLQGEAAHYLFTLKNTGDAPLEIAAKSNCGCTVASYDKVIAPGAVGKIEAQIRTEGFRGRIGKTIDVTTNDPQQPRISLQLSADVLSVVNLLPASQPPLALKDDAPTVRELQVQLRDTEPVELKGVTCSVPYATARAEPVEGGSGNTRTYRVTLTVQPDAPIGRTPLSVTLFTTSKREPQASFGFLCEKGILALPLGVYLGAIGPRTPLPVTQIVTLMRREGTFHVRKVESSDPRVEARAEMEQEGTQYRLTLTCRGGGTPGVFSAKIRVETDDARQPRIEISVVGSVIP
jgi:hypothetical protein